MSVYMYIHTSVYIHIYTPIGDVREKVLRTKRQRVADNFAAFAKDTKLTARTRCQDVNGSSSSSSRSSITSSFNIRQKGQKGHRHVQGRHPQTQHSAYSYNVWCLCYLRVKNFCQTKKKCHLPPKSTYTHIYKYEYFIHMCIYMYTLRIRVYFCIDSVCGVMWCGMLYLWTFRLFAQITQTWYIISIKSQTMG